jgi:hypothetical protein
VGPPCSGQQRTGTPALGKPRKRCPSDGGPRVRIHFPPAGSQVRTRHPEARAVCAGAYGPNGSPYSKNFFKCEIVHTSPADT